jgi:hypothetical protein
MQNSSTLAYVARPDIRIHAIDFTKGVLVLLMVLYHALNYLEYGSVPHDYMAFLPPSFIIIAGFLVVELNAAKSTRGTYRQYRLVVRALKLLLIFSGLNLGARLVWARGGHDVREFFVNWRDVYFLANDVHVTFDVLVPIAYTLVVAAATLRADHAKRGLFALLGILFCAVIAAIGNPSNGLNLVSAGLLGMWLGTFRRRDIDRLAASWGTITAAIAAYIAVAMLAADDYLSQIAKTILVVGMLYAIGRKCNEATSWFQQICLLGKYSLLAYIVQILYLQGVRGLQSAGGVDGVAVLAIVTLAVALSTWATVVALDYARSRNTAVDRLYTVVFA